MSVADSTATKEIVRIAFDSTKPSLTLESDWLVIIIIALCLSLYFLIRKRIIQGSKWREMTLEISGSPKLSFKVERNYENLYIANRIYIELTTRKAAIPIVEDQDVIEEIYNSWYELFKIIRNEIKSLPGKYLKNHDPTTALIGLTRSILNIGLRPHLTEHQAKFRAWLKKAKEEQEYQNLTPQQLQKEYPDYDELIVSMKGVSQVLIHYAEELDKLIKK